MNLIKSLLLIIAVTVLWSTSDLIKAKRLNHLVDNGQIPYGPLPDTNLDYYSFGGLKSAFDSKLEVKRAEEFSKKEFQDLILHSLDHEDRSNFQKYLVPTLALSEEYQIDPFWIISVMMIESRFQTKATSHKNAKGLMQIRPETAGHLYSLMGKKVSESQLHLNLHRPVENIEMGVFYLKKLLQNFRNNYHLATIAYNVGPNKLRNLLVTDDIDTVHFSYLVKVKNTYKELSTNFAQELKKRQRPFEITYVVRDQSNLLEDSILKIYISSLPTLDTEALLSSENL